MKAINKYWSVIIWCIVIFSLSSIPVLPKVGFIWWDFILKKTAHMIEYGILFFLYYKSMGINNNLKTPFLFGMAFALSDEYHQSFVVGRTSKLTDVGFDTIGMIIAMFKIKYF